MRVVHITPGTGDSFYCENCVRDSALVIAMRSLGHDVLIIPMYLPMQGDKNEPVGNAPIFFGGINVYLQQKSAFFQKTPRWLDRIFDSPKLLSWLARKSKMTSAGVLAETTISMLRGEEGRQVKELNRLIEWLDSQENKPDIICLSNVLLIGLAKSIKARLGVPIACLLQDEDDFLDGLVSPYKELAWEMIAELSRDVDAFIAVSKYFSSVMQKKLQLSAERMHVAYSGISLDGYESPQAEPKVPTIGYLSRMCPDRGLDTLVDAFIILKSNENLEKTRLHIAGGKSGNDELFLNRIRKKLASCGFIDDVRFLPAFDRDTKLEFFQSLSLLSVPEKRPIAYGLYILEALAAGVPVVEPKSGAFPELLDITGGGVLFESNNAEALAEAIQPLLLDPDYAQKLGKQGKKQVFQKFNVEQTAKDLMRIYQTTVQQFP
ncbi:MAG: glycosyltransferase [Phycisphaerae bacterium]|nr:glycosyltransferase family 4 protein [Phycisphaerae bacterium]NIP50776.1 glycosyltransferase family 4 protein [Phycisphaerae bacterium]NIS49940.1 glycosyltransferase family 4 protein [Phycisphaerae bacterium]NIU07644.1 glycosyltransferase family 4 protein [Phycisphaerae bacterium]NIU57426.1 glycosyltransferase [Phycisphaerae bacterium]